MLRRARQKIVIDEGAELNFSVGIGFYINV